MITKLVADNRRWLKLAILAGLYLALSFYYQDNYWLHQNKWRNLAHTLGGPEAMIGRRTAVVIATVDRPMENGRGMIVRVGHGKMPLKVEGLTGLARYDKVDVSGLVVAADTLRAEKIRVHSTPRWVKLGVSLAAVGLAFLIFFRGFRLIPGRIPRPAPRD